MRIQKSTICANLRYLDVQVPTMSLVITDSAISPVRVFDQSLRSSPEVGVLKDEWIEAPASWFIDVKNNRLALGRETGLLYLSPEGVRNLLPMLREAFDAITTHPDPVWCPRGSWNDFRAKLRDFFIRTIKATEREVRKWHPDHPKGKELADKLPQLVAQWNELDAVL